jgi:predicted phosphodiesterase
MKIQIASDLHLEQLPAVMKAASPTFITPAADADLLILAGDIDNDLAGIDAFKDWPVPVLYVPGNHEFYGCGHPGLTPHLRKAAEGTSVTVLDRDALTLGGVRFLGCTLWTDFLLNRSLSQASSMSAAEARLLDFSKINTQKGLFRAKDALEDHERSRAWLNDKLQEPFSGKTVVITHHGPHPLSVHPRYFGDQLNAAFVSDLTPLLFHPDLWIHGHVHDSFDYRVGKARVVCNPKGYVTNRTGVTAGHQPAMENPAFQPHLVIEV